MNMQFRHEADNQVSPSVLSPRFLVEAVSCGPVGYLKAAVIGFIVGSVVLLIVIACTPKGVVVDAALSLGAYTGGGAAVGLLGALFVNLLDGLRFREAQKLQRSIFASDGMSPRMPPPDARRIILAKSKSYGSNAGLNDAQRVSEESSVAEA